MRIPKHVSVAFDLVCMGDWVPAVMAFHGHSYISPPPGPPIIKVPMGTSVEIPVTILWPAGALLGDNKLTSTVYHRHVWFALEGHDCGHGIMHLCVPPLMPGPCVEMELNILFSSRKAKFTAGEVKANGAAVACCTMFDSLAPATPMMTCGALPLPNTGTGTAVAFNSLLVGMHPVDLLAGWVDVVVSMVSSVLFNGVVEVGNWGEGLGISPIPDFGAIAGGLVRGLGQEFGDYHGDAGIGYSPVNGPLGGVGRSVVRDGATGDITDTTTGGVQAGGLGGGQETHRDIHRADGTVVEQESVTGTTAGGGQYERGGERINGGDWHSMPTTGDNNPSLPWSEGTEVPFL